MMVEVQKNEGILKNVQYLSSELLGEDVKYTLNFYVAFVIAAILFVVAFIVMNVTNFNFAENVIFLLFLLFVYFLFIFFLMKPKILRELMHTEVRNYEMPILKEVVREVEKPVYIEREIKGRQVAKPKYYDFVGSSLTRVYHRRNCRLSKSIKKKHLEKMDDAKIFKAMGFRPCKACILKKKKV